MVEARSPRDAAKQARAAGWRNPFGRPGSPPTTGARFWWCPRHVAAAAELYARVAAGAKA